MPLTVPFNAPSEVAFTPSWTNITLGNGTNLGFYVLNGKRIDFRAEFTLGSTSAMGSSPTLALPLTASRAPLTSQIQVVAIDAGVAIYPGTLGDGITTTSTATILVLNAAGTYLTQGAITATTPHTWGTGDKLQLSGWYMVV